MLHQEKIKPQRGGEKLSKRKKLYSIKKIWNSKEGTKVMDWCNWAFTWLNYIVYMASEI